MIPDPDQVQRLGFEAWADNVIVNLVENFGKSVTTDDCFNIQVERYPEETSYIVRAYVQGRGWLTHTRVVKHPNP